MDPHALKIPGIFTAGKTSPRHFRLSHSYNSSGTIFCRLPGLLEIERVTVLSSKNIGTGESICFAKT
jgi:hypothetical protein